MTVDARSPTAISNAVTEAIPAAEVGAMPVFIPKRSKSIPKLTIQPSAH